jgi:hypothetical protein
MIAKPISSKGTGGKSDVCAWKAIELISVDLLHVSDSRLTMQQKSAAGVALTRVRKAQTVSASVERRTHGGPDSIAQTNESLAIKII